MFQPIYIKVKNFGSIKSLNYSFQTGKPLVLQGKNLDDRGQKSNGVGKSSFNDSFGFTLTGLSLRNLSNDELIRDGENTSELELCLRSKDLTSELIIKRFLFRKESQKIEIWLNGNNEHKDLPDVNARNQFIIDTIGISKEDLFQFFIITEERYKPYFRLSDTDKKGVSGRFSNSNSVDKVLPLLDADIDKQVKVIKTIENTLIGFKSKISTYQEEIEAANDIERKEALKETYRQKIHDEYINQKTYKSNQELLANEIIKLDVKISELKKTLISQEDVDIKLEMINQLEEENIQLEKEFKSRKIIFDNALLEGEKRLKEINTNIRECNSGIDEINILWSQSQAKLRSLIDCPACKHKFILDSDETLEDIINNIKELESTKKDIEKDLKKHKENITLEITNNKLNESKISQLTTELRLDTEENRKQITILKNLVAQLEKQNWATEQSIVTTEREISTKTNSIGLLSDKYKQSESKIKQYHIDLENVDKINDSAVVARYENLIEECENEINLVSTKLEEEENELQRLNSWVLRFKSFKSYLANQSLKNIEDLANFYLQKMNTDLSVEIAAFQQKKKDVKEKITETIKRNGFPVGSYGRFSGGERARLDMSLIFAMQTLINNNAAPRGLDFIQIDEVMDSLDSLGIENIIKAIENIDKTLILVTQNEINTLPNQTITLVKRNNCTEIE